MKYHHYIFDLDGTLIDTEKPLYDAWLETLAEEGYSMSEEDFIRIQGNPMTVILNDVLKVDVRPGFEERWIQSYSHYCQTADYFPGIEAMLDELLARGCHLGIVTSRDRAEFHAFFEKFHLEDRFGVIVLADNTPYHKPEPGVLYYYAEQTGADLADCLFTGDMTPDITTGHNAGVDTALAGWNASATSTITPTYILKKPSDLLN